MTTPALQQRNSLIFKASYPLAIATIFLALIVFLGWFLKIEELIQIHASFVPMQFNTALGFFLCGVSLAFRHKGYKRVSSIVGFLVVLLGATTLYQYIAGVNLGIDQLFMQHYITVETSHPGRMAPNTAVCFILSGCAFLLLGAHKRAEVKLPLAVFFGWGILALGLVSLIGYIIGLEVAYGWASYSNMAVHTSIGFVFVGISITAKGLLEQQSLPTDLNTLRRSIVFYASASVIFISFFGALVAVLPFYESFKETTDKSLSRDLFFLGETIGQYLNRKKDIATQVSSRTKARQVFEQFVKGSVSSKEFQEASRRIFGDAMARQDDILGILRTTVDLKHNIEIGTKISKEVKPNIPERMGVVELGLPFMEENKLRIVTATLVGKDNDNIVGVDYVLFSLEELSTVVFEARKITGFSYLAIGVGENLQEKVFRADKTGKLIEHGDLDKTLTSTLDKSLTSTNYGKLDIAASENDGVAMVDYFQQLLGGKWVVVLRVFPEVVHSSANDKFLGIIIGVFSFSLLSCFGIYRLVKPFSGAILIEAGELQRKIDEATETIRANETQLRRSNEELEQFAYVTSHDLQEPLRKIMTFCGYLKEDMGGELNNEAKKDIEVIVSAASRMRTLIEDLLNLSRIGRKELRMELVSIERCVDEALEALSGMIKEKSVTIVKSDGLSNEVKGDKTLLTQLFQNLIGNAIKFTKDHKPRVEITVEKIDNVIVYGVKDTGIGIKPEYLQKIFAPFQRLHGRKEFEGTGIGLSICNKAIERHEGRIWVESEPGQWSHFKFTLWDRGAD